VPFERTGQRLVEVVEVEDQPLESEKPDPGRARRFLGDFGFTVGLCALALFFRGCAPQPRNRHGVPGHSAPRQNRYFIPDAADAARPP
jgi:hypothetical protein